MKIYFGTSIENGELLGCPRTKEEVQKIVKNQLDLMDYRSYYQRYTFNEDGVTWIDYGSWSKFFFIVSEEGEDPTSYIMR